MDETKEQRKEAIIDTFRPKTVTETEEALKENRERNKYFIPVQYQRLLENSKYSMRDLPNYDPVTDTLLPPEGQKKHNVFNPETGLIENPDWLVKTRVFLADAIEGLALGRDIFDIDDVVAKPDWQDKLLGAVGGLVTDTSLFVTTSILMGMVFPGIVANPSSTGGQLLLKGTNVALREGLKLGAYHRARELINPEVSNKEKSTDSTLFAVGAGIGRTITETLLAKYSPLSPMVVDRLVTNAVGVLTGHLSNFYKYDSPEEFFDDYFSVNTLVYIMADMVVFEYLSRKEGTPEHIARQVERFNRQVREYNKVPSEENQELLIRQMVDLYEYFMETDPDTMARTMNLYGEKLINQVNASLQLVREHGDWVSKALTGSVSPNQTWGNVGIVDDPKALQPYSKEDVNQDTAQPIRDVVRGLQAIDLYDSMEDLIGSTSIVPPAPGSPQPTVARPEVLPEPTSVIPPSPELPQPTSARPVTPPAPSRPQPISPKPTDEAQEIIEKVALGGVSPEEAARLDSGTPREGTALINTSRMVASPETKKLAEALAGVSSTFESKTYKNIYAAAEDNINRLTTKSLDDLLKEAEESVKHLQGVSELWTTIRMLNAGTKEQFLEKVREGTLSELPPAEQGKLLLLKDLYTELARLHKDLGSALGQGLSSGNIYVGGEQVNLFDLLTTENKEVFLERYQAELEKYGGDPQAVVNVLNLFGMTAGYDVQGIEGKEVSTSKPLRKNVLDSIVELQKNMLVSPLTSKAFTVASQGIGIGWDMASHSLAGFYSAIGRRLVGPEKWGSHDISFEEVGARAMGYLEGTIMSFTKPLTTFRELMEYEGNEEAVETLWDNVKLLIKDPKTFEEYFNKTSLTPHQGYFDSTPRAITAENWLGNIEDRPVLEVLGTMIDYFGATVRLVGFGSLEAVSRPMELAGYVAELNSQLLRIDGISSEDFNRYKEATLLYRAGLTVRNSWREAVENDLGRPLAYDERDIVDNAFWEHYADGMFSKMDIAELNLIRRLDALAANHGESMVWKQPFQNHAAQRVANFHRDYKVLQVLVPFISTSMKQMGRALGRIGFRKDFIRDLLGKTLTMDGQVDRAKQMKTLADFTLSMLTIWGAAVLYNKGRLAPRGATSAARRSQQEAGMPEFGLRIGSDKWFPTNRLGPEFMLANLTVSTIRDITELLQDGHTDNATILEMGGTLLQDMALTLTSGTAMIGARDALDLITGRANPSTVVKSLLEGLNPARPVTTTLERYSLWGLNPLYKEFKTEKFLSDKPILDTMGRPVAGHKNILGLQYTQQSDSPIDREILATRAYLTPVPKTLNGIKLSDDEYYALLRVLDAEVGAEEQLNRLVTSSAYQKLSTEQQKEAIRRNWETLVDRAQRLFMKDMDKYVERYVEVYRQSVESKYFEVNREEWVDAATGNSGSSGASNSSGAAKRRQSQADSPWE